MWVRLCQEERWKTWVRKRVLERYGETQRAQRHDDRVWSDICREHIQGKKNEIILLRFLNLNVTL